MSIHAEHSNDPMYNRPQLFCSMSKLNLRTLVSSL